jgi:hypothetical protein
LCYVENPDDNYTTDRQIAVCGITKLTCSEIKSSEEYVIIQKYVFYKGRCVGKLMGEDGYVYSADGTPITPDYWYSFFIGDHTAAWKKTPKAAAAAQPDSPPTIYSQRSARTSIEL